MYVRNSLFYVLVIIVALTKNVKTLTKYIAYTQPHFVLPYIMCMS